MTDTLKHCPFCGGKAKITDLKQAPETWVECTECGARTRFFSNSEEACVSAWNARSIEEKQAERIKHLQKERAEAIEQNYKNAFDIQMQAERDTKYALKENARLREALEWIVNCKPIIDVGYPDIIQKAKEALRGREE